MTDTLLDALKRMDVVRTGYVFRNQEGEPMTDNEAKYHCYRLCHLAGLPEKGWHILRHTFGTHAAMFGANPWKLMTWMGHKRIDETMLYVHVAGIHLRPHPAPVLEAQRGHDDPDLKVLAMLSARRLCLPVRGKNVAKNGESHLPKIEKA
ncbi:MAG: tyrosine-type recombinase/integrase, partial [Myxococcales bacterium]|nr:tyrosine-type recombinase/integrase [Myxococcales bacterium]